MAEQMTLEMQEYISGIDKALAIAKEWNFSPEEKTKMLGLDPALTRGVNDLAAHCARAGTSDIRQRCQMIAHIHSRAKRCKGGAEKVLNTPFSQRDRRTRRSMIVGGFHELRLVFYSEFK